jgi:ubiquinone/menaquinone biosynthesis C-methylase UbiE
MATESDELKKVVKDTYSEIARHGKSASSCCASTSCCSTTDFTFSDDYSKKDGYVAEADLGLGCGIPTDVAKIKPGDTVLDLGSGAGNDVFVARSFVGEEGKVIGIDMTPEMIERAEKNKAKLGYSNVEFRLGDIEQMPVDSNSVNVAVSNCVLNLVPNKAKAFAELYRVLKPGGHFSVSDIVLVGDLPPAVQRAAEMYAGCVSGALQKEEYLRIIRRAGFQAVQVKKEKRMDLTDELLQAYISKAETDEYRRSGAGVLSITVYAEKPATTCCGGKEPCC